MILAIFTAGAFLAVQTVGSASPVAQAAKVATPSASADDAVVCHSIVYTGTRFSSKECHTTREWRQMAADAASYQQDIDMRANQYCFNPALCKH
jgi:hypothetical protein